MVSRVQIFWFAAFVGLSAYTNKGISAGEAKEKDAKLKKEGGCAVFEAGTGETKKACQMYKSGVGLAVFMWYAICPVETQASNHTNPISPQVLVACNHWNRRLRCMVLQTTHHLAVR